MPDALSVLRDSPFFAGVEAEDLAALGPAGRFRRLNRGEPVITEGAPASAFSVLVSGSVALSFETEAPPQDGGPDETGNADPLQTISHPGYPIGWSALVPPYVYRATATAREPTVVLTLERKELEQRARDRPSFGVRLMQAVIGLVGARLRATRLRLVARRYDDDVLAIRELIEETEPRLHVASPIHKLPYYLEQRMTLADAFHVIDLLRTDGDELEQELAELCADLLGNVRRELWLYQSLQEIYDSVASAPADLRPEAVRERSMHEFHELFRETSYRIVGRELLPEAPGHIFIMNHLKNHPDNLLPNRFILTLDTHFVSSMILFERYGRAPVRVIRGARSDEFGHQGFYDRLGYIYVYPGHVDPEGDDPAASAEAGRRAFLDAAGSHLRAGTNVVICPEGTSTSTEESPLRFRPGAFDLAAHVEPEPLLVPIAVANFDKKITRVTTCAVVHEPFRLSERLGNPNDEGELRDFIDGEFHRSFVGWVREAVELARS
jgi:CRP-like cAMP-binding protein